MADDPAQTDIQTDTQTETELKFIVPPERLAALRAAMPSGEVETLRLEAVYFDTADDRLASHAVALRVRREGDRWVQTAKALTADAVRRHEHNVERGPAPGDGAPVFDLALHDGTAVGAAIASALGDAQPEDLVARFRTEVSRTTLLQAHDGAMIELALDTGQVIAGDRADPVCELEFELKSGPVRALFEVAATWTAAHGLWLGTVTKAERAERLLRAVVHGEPTRAVPPVVDPKAGLDGFSAAVLSACLAQVVGNASEIGAGATDEEFIHQLRVGLRRLRTALGDLLGPFHGIEPAWEVALHDAFQRLGAHRDAIALGAKLQHELTAAGFPGLLHDASSDVDAPDPGAVVRDPAFQQALLGLMAFCRPDAAPPAPTRRARHRLKRRLAARLAKLHEAVLRDADRFSRLAPERQHQVRKRLKRLRYLAEFTAPVFGTRRVERFLKRWRAAQDALGENNDLCVGLDTLRSQAPAGHPRRQAVRWMRERQQACARRCERRLGRAAKRQVFWKS